MGGRGRGGTARARGKLVDWRPPTLWLASPSRAQQEAKKKEAAKRKREKSSAKKATPAAKKGKVGAQEHGSIEEGKKQSAGDELLAWSEEVEVRTRCCSSPFCCFRCRLLLLPCRRGAGG